MPAPKITMARAEELAPTVPGWYYCDDGDGIRPIQVLAFRDGLYAVDAGVRMKLQYYGWYGSVPQVTPAVTPRLGSTIL